MTNPTPKSTFSRLEWIAIAGCMGLALYGLWRFLTLYAHIIGYV